MVKKCGAPYMSKENTSGINIAMVIWYLYFRSFCDRSMVSSIVFLLQKEIRTGRKRKNGKKGEERKRMW